MVKPIFVCEECSFAYLDKKAAQNCEKWCKEHKSCNIDLTKASIGSVGWKNEN